MTDKNIPGDNGREIRPSPTINYLNKSTSNLGIPYGFFDTLKDAIFKIIECKEDQIQTIMMYGKDIVYQIEDNCVLVFGYSIGGIINNETSVKTLGTEWIEEYQIDVLSRICDKEEVFSQDMEILFVGSDTDGMLSLDSILPDDMTELDLGESESYLTPYLEFRHEYLSRGDHHDRGEGLSSNTTSLSILPSRIEAISMSIFKVVNYKNSKLKGIEIDNMIIVYGFSDTGIVVFGQVDQQTGATETELPIKLLGSELAAKLRVEINNYICASHKLTISDLPLKFWGTEGELYLSDNSFSEFPQEKKIVEDIIEDIIDYEDNLISSEELDKGFTDSYYEINSSENGRNTVFFDSDYLEEGMKTLFVKDTEYIYELIDSVLEIIVKISSHGSDGSVTGVYLSLEEMRNIGLDIAQAIILSEGKNLEDIDISYMSTLGAVRQDEISDLRNSQDNDAIITKMDRDNQTYYVDLSDPEVFTLQEGVNLYQDSIYIENFSQKDMKVCRWDDIEYLYALRGTTLLFYGEVIDKEKDAYSLNVFKNYEMSGFGEQLTELILKGEGLERVNMDVLYKRGGGPDFLHIEDGLYKQTFDPLGDFLWLSANKTTLD